MVSFGRGHLILIRMQPYLDYGERAFLPALIRRGGQPDGAPLPTNEMTKEKKQNNNNNNNNNNN